jgi:hypothetical protein
MPLTGLTVDETLHNMDGMLLHARDGSENVRAFISRRVMAIWVEPIEPVGQQKSLSSHAIQFAWQAKPPAAIGRIASRKYNRGLAFNRQHPFVGILYSDITESGEALDVSDLARKTRP